MSGPGFHANYGSYTINESNANFLQPSANDSIAYQSRTVQLGFRTTFRHGRIRIDELVVFVDSQRACSERGTPFVLISPPGFVP